MSGHDHRHASISVGAKHRGRLVAAFFVIVVFMVVEAVAAVLTGSLALLSDAGHMLTDALGIGMALAAITLAARDRHHAHRTYGLYRLEILAALANAVLLFGVAGWVAWEAIRRIGHPVDVASGPMFVVAVAGLIANIVAFALLREGAKESINVEGAYLEVVADLIGSIGVIIGAILIRITGWPWLDPAIGVAIGAFILPRTWRLAARAIRILVQAAPEDADLDAIADDLGAVEGVVDVHDLHVWTLTSAMDVATAHLMITDDAEPETVLIAARTVLDREHGIEHATLQIEPRHHVGCDDAAWCPADA